MRSVVRQADDGADASTVRSVGLLGCLVFFWMIGPFVAHLVFFVGIAMQTFDEPPSAVGLAERMSRVALSGMLLLPAAWIYGSLPAIATAIGYWALPAAIRATVIGATITSACMGFVVCGGMAAMAERDFAVLLRSETLGLLLAGGIAAGVCALVLECLQRRNLSGRDIGNATEGSLSGVDGYASKARRDDDSSGFR